MVDAVNIKKLALIANRNAGKGKAFQAIQEARRHLWGWPIEVIWPSSIDELRGTLEVLSPAEYQAAVVMGGDGTLNQVLRGRGSDPLPLCVFPIGTANDFGQEMGVRADWNQIQKLVDRSSVERVDLLEVNGVPFLTVAGIGVGAILTKEFNEGRHRSRIFREAMMFSVLVVPDSNPVKLVSTLLKLKMGTLSPRDCILFATREGSIKDLDGRPLQVFGDGEPLVESPSLEFRLRYFFSLWTLQRVLKEQPQIFLGKKVLFHYLEKKFPRRAWDLSLMTLGNATIFNAMFYKGHFPRKNVDESFFGFYRECFSRLFSQGLVRENFFLQLLFFGKVVFAEGCPVECDPKVFALAKRALGDTEIVYREGDVLETAKSVSEKVDFFSLSDVPSYFSGDTERNFLQWIRGSLNPSALVVVRNYLRVPEKLKTAGFENVTHTFADPIAKEKVQVYLVDVYRRKE